MEKNLPELVSKIRYELFSTTKEVKCLTNLFRYFNAVYGEINHERETEKNPASALKSKGELVKISNTSINLLFEKVFVMLKDGLNIERNASSDLMLIYSIGLEAQLSIGELNEFNKKDLFKKIIDQYNYEFHSSFVSTKDFMLDRKSRKDFESTNED